MIASRSMSDEVAQLLLAHIPTLPKRVSTSELAAELTKAGRGLGARALQKRLLSLQAEHGLDCLDTSKPYQWAWPKGKKEKHFPAMLPHEALSLLLAAEHLRTILPPRSIQWLEERLEQSRREVDGDHAGRAARWREKVRRVPHDLPRIAPRVDAKVFRAVSESLFEGLQLALVYRKRFAHEPREYQVHPLALCEREGELWLAARKADADDQVRFFLLHRMDKATILRGQPVVPPAGFDLDAALARGLAHFRLELGEAIDLKARFHEKVVDKLIESPLSDDQRIERVDGGHWFRLRARVPHTRALQSFLLGYGPLCVVESPKQLRESLVKDLRKALAAY